MHMRQPHGAIVPCTPPQAVARCYAMFHMAAYLQLDLNEVATQVTAGSRLVQRHKSVMSHAARGAANTTMQGPAALSRYCLQSCNATATACAVLELRAALLPLCVRCVLACAWCPLMVCLVNMVRWHSGTRRPPPKKADARLTNSRIIVFKK